MKRFFTWGAALFVTATLAPWAAVAQDAHDHTHEHATTAANPAVPPFWSDSVIELFASLPVQDEGRIKPLDTFAQFTLLKLNGKRSYSLSDDEQVAMAEATPDAILDDVGTKKRLSPIEWLMNVLLYPDAARDYRNFIVDNSEAVTAIGVDAHSKLRDRYSYNELLVGRSKLSELAMQYFDIDAKQRTPVQQQILNLAHNISQFEYLIHYLDFARAHYHLDEGGALAVAFPEGDNVRASTVLLRMPAIVEELRSQVGADAEEIPAAVESQVQELTQLLNAIQGGAALSQSLALFPPQDIEAKEWLTPAELVAQATNFDSPPAESRLEAMGKLEEVVAHRDDPIEFERAVAGLNANLKTMAQERGEYEKISVELAYYNGKYLFYSQWLYVVSFVVIVFSLLFPKNKPLKIIGPISVTIPTVLLVIAITMRCIIRDRPPVSTLYETILFITACVAIVGLFIEYVNRQRIALITASILGVVGLFLAYRYEAKEGTDTMPNLVAVLDTNFWLSTHVTTVTMGYAAGLLAAALAHIYIFGKRFNLKKDDKVFYKNITRMTYGVVCFGFLFACVGTILGGIWANYSWGRFWGWDPKENGALMICLWGLIMLHARMGGYIRDLGIAITSIIMGMIVAFSWWGVNLLGVGLHSYGFTSGIMNMLVIFWAIESLVVMMGLTVGLKERALAYSGLKSRPEGAPTTPQHTTARTGGVAHRSRTK